MAKIIFRVDGEDRPVDVAHGSSLMKGAVEAGVPGIIGECGGNAMCATCHVYTPVEEAPRLPPVGTDEDEMLDCTASQRLPGSRLSCQLVADEVLDGLVIDVPAEQI